MRLFLLLMLSPQRLLMLVRWFGRTPGFESLLTCLWHRHPNTVLSMATDFYEALFTADVITRATLDACKVVWSHTRFRVTVDMSLALMTPFSFDDLQVVVGGLDPSSCLGDDGLTREFFLEHWDVLHVHLLRGCQSIFTSEVMPESLCSGLISLTSKGGEATLLRHWRPITLLSSVYKILAKMISARLRPYLLDLIHSSRTSFVQDICILNHIFKFHHAMDWASSSGQPLALLLLDFEKAYDKLDWDFLEGTLLRMGFPDAWICGVAALYRLAWCAITIAGCTSRSFQLFRLVRQGWPLAPYLFLFVAEAMSDFIRAQTPRL
ncbi:hypothetical protein GOP47_0024231 [Adiantum capillus-veneris]|uniref:Reverse transcriptase domain-containing protein n=1 Tax=Adiantum capillus-veneris TaxID=13818 RepID=A0A9D4U7G5_ADICA|nr:hypothetical protein GOP47_0024231 [Adiantum capillus-veneris]